ncbi:MAG: hypothetical protein JSS63_14930 [Bacteroidetes bacterium]|nr:hypothetical protein [Bacteroidota bacterium]MBX7045947.1 hypothetical protein [Ignavibacteria bacterium]
MLKRFSPAILSIVFILSGFITLQSCNKDGGEKKDSTKNSGSNSEFIKGDIVTLKLKPKKGETARYSMETKNSRIAASVLGSKENKFSQAATTMYYFTQEVSDVEEDIVTYKIKIDSVKLTNSGTQNDSTITISYNSNVKDSVYNQPENIPYNSLVGENFFIRVSARGELSNLYGLEKVYDKIFKSLGDTISQQVKSEIKTNFEEQFKSEMQQQFPFLPEAPIKKDSAWTKSTEMQIMYFPAKNVISYKIADIKTENGETIVTINGELSIQVLKDELKEKGSTVKLESSNFNGKATVVFNLTKGILLKKETSTTAKLDIKVSDGRQALKNSEENNSGLSLTIIK